MSNKYIQLSLYKFVYFDRGQTPADAEFNFLDHAKRLDMYGVDLYQTKVSENLFKDYNKQLNAFMLFF